MRSKEEAIMKTQFKKKMIIISTILMIVGLVFGVTVTGLHAGRCEDAYKKCLSTIGYSPVSIHCGIGYVFCKKYIE
jgi:hypothetical protein